MLRRSCRVVPADSAKMQAKALCAGADVAPDAKELVRAQVGETLQPRDAPSPREGLLVGEEVRRVALANEHDFVQSYERVALDRLLSC
jgi:hypothetical protein